MPSPKKVCSVLECLQGSSRGHRTEDSDSEASSPLLPPPVPVACIPPDLLPTNVAVPTSFQPKRTPPPVPQEVKKTPRKVPTIRVPIEIVNRKRDPPPPLPYYKFPNLDFPDDPHKMLIK